ncbi:MAG: NAD(P)-dependent oxidoreductase [Chloroflexi bacterium]|nr:NAD(P)-dependent oxidoreductase [Chloroflexota bacterium]
MQVLVTGSEGGIGRVQVDLLRSKGHEVRTLDQAASRTPDAGEHFEADLRDRETVAKAVEGTDAVVHLGAIPGDREGYDAEIMQINVQGTWNVMDACKRHGVRRAVCFSSIQALGNVCGFHESLRFPINDSYPRHPMSAYQLSKHLGEEVCRSFTNRYGIVTICLRPVGVLRSEDYQRWSGTPRDDARPGSVSNHWSYVDVRDVCDAALRGLEAENVSHDAFLLAADDTATLTPTADLVERFYAHVPWPEISQEEYLASSPHRTLVDCSHAKEVLGWQPQHSWRSPRTSRADCDSGAGEQRH